MVNTVKLPHFNNAAEKQTIRIDTPPEVIISMSQHGGSPCVPTVSVDDYVKTGQLIGRSESFVSAPIHASITGTVKEEREITNINGVKSRALVIEAADRQEVSEEVVPPVVTNTTEFLDAVKASGSVGLGGAGFPTHVKLAYDKTKYKVDTLVVNGAECEPYITSDYREFIENTDEILEGIKLIMKYIEIDHAVIGIENDKPVAIRKMQECVNLGKENYDIKVISLKSKYPQGAEKVLVRNTTGRIIKEKALPMSEGCIVMNSSTIAFIARYIKSGRPLIRRRITIDGNIVNKPLNIIAPIGTPLETIINKVDLRKPADRIIFGGPMMGNTAYDYNAPVTKTLNAVLFFADSKEYKETACIRCGKCVYVCSMNLAPIELEHAYDRKDKDALEKLGIFTCIECGACSYICPAKRNIAQKNGLAKGLFRK